MELSKEKYVRLFDFLENAGRLKDTVRAGWELKEVKNPESVADHTMRICLLVSILSEQNEVPLDELRCLKMALIHDLPESITGDITPHDGITEMEKVRREKAAMSDLMTTLESKDMLGLWNEFCEQKTPESQFVKDMDIIETLTQALEYETTSRNKKSLSEFWEWAETRLNTPMGIELLQALKRRKMDHQHRQ